MLLKKYETERDAALGELKELSGEVRSLIEEEERYMKANRARRFEIEKQKSLVGSRARAAQEKIDALEAKIPREVLTALSERESKVTQLTNELGALKRELSTAQFNVKFMRDKGAKRDELKEMTDQTTHLEGLVEEMESDLDEAKKSFEAAQILKREALEEVAKAEPVAQ